MTASVVCFGQYRNRCIRCDFSGVLKRSDFEKWLSKCFQLRNSTAFWTEDKLILEFARGYRIVMEILHSPRFDIFLFYDFSDRKHCVHEGVVFKFPILLFSFRLEFLQRYAVVLALTFAMYLRVFCAFELNALPQHEGTRCWQFFKYVLWFLRAVVFFFSRWRLGCKLNYSKFSYTRRGRAQPPISPLAAHKYLL